MATKNKQPKNLSQPKIIVPVIKVKTIYQLFLKVAICVLLIIGAIFYTDSKGFFNPDYSNDHTRRKWNTYYNFTKEHNVDVVLVGNSHLYTGVSPENLSNALGANCFILASPGTTLTDTYFCLKEAIGVCKPKIAIVETFTINDYNSHELKDGALADQLKSFSARKNIPQKLASTSILFNSGNYLSAWFRSIRNHSFIFTDRAQIEKNIAIMKNEPEEKKGLYLGRFARFHSGLEDSTLLKYDKPGFAAYNGNKFAVSNEAKEYIHKIEELCHVNNVKLIFLTLPMYHRHVKNYEVCKSKLSQELTRNNALWLDLQSPYDAKAFTPDCFENTINSNQHMTYHGSLVAAYKLAHFIRDNCSDKLPDRSTDIKWKKLFYGEEGYFENHSPENDGVNSILLKNVITKEKLVIAEIDFVKQKDRNLLLIKANKNSNKNMMGKTLRVIVEASMGGQKAIIPLEAVCSPAYDPMKHYLFLSTPLRRDVEILAVKDIVFKI